MGPSFRAAANFCSAGRGRIQKSGGVPLAARRRRRALCIGRARRRTLRRPRNRSRSRLFRARAGTGDRAQKWLDLPKVLKQAWLAALAHERRASPHTLRAYGDDRGALSRFLRRAQGPHAGRSHAGQACRPPTSAPSSRCGATKGLGARGVQRALAAVRSFFRHLAREGILENAAPRAIRTPRVARTPAAPAQRKRCGAHAGRSGRARCRMAGRARRGAAHAALWRGPAHFRGLEAQARRRAARRIAQRARQGAQGTQRSRPAGGARSGGALCGADSVFRRARRRRCFCRAAASR